MFKVFAKKRHMRKFARKAREYMRVYRATKDWPDVDDILLRTENAVKALKTHRCAMDTDLVFVSDDVEAEVVDYNSQTPVVLFYIPIVPFSFLSFVGTTGETVTVTCSTGYSGGGTATCGTNGQFNTLTCKANTCTPTQVTNSNKEAANTNIQCKDNEILKVSHAHNAEWMKTMQRDLMEVKDEMRAVKDDSSVASKDVREEANRLHKRNNFLVIL